MPRPLKGGRNANMKSANTIAPRSMSGKMLSRKWGVAVRHALYHKDGHWYNNLERFPGALFDPNGYVVFNTEKEYRKCPYLSIGKETNVPRGISDLPGYKRMR